MRVLLDTSVLIGDDPPEDVESAISVASITELHFGLLVTDDAEERARRTDRLAAVEAVFDPIPISVEIGRGWGRLTAAVARRGGKPRRRQIDLAIAATALARGGATTDSQRCRLRDHQGPGRRATALSRHRKRTVE